MQNRGYGCCVIFLAEYNLRIFLDSTKEGIWGTEVPVGSRGEASEVVM